MTERDRTDTLDPVSAYCADVVVCLRFFSRLALALPDRFSRLAGRRRLAGAVRALPLACALIALPAACVLAALSAIGLPPLASAGVALAVLAITTGALHEDGLADVCDGFFGGRDPEQRLTIMRDSRIGAFGALGLALTVLVRASLLAALTAEAPLIGAAGLIAAAAASRTAMLWPWVSLPAARPDGLARLVGSPLQSAVVVAGMTAAVLVFVLTVWFAPLAVLPAAIGAALAGWALAISADRQIGGHTGDVLGATQHVAEIAVLAAIAISVT